MWFVLLVFRRSQKHRNKLKGWPAGALDPIRIASETRAPGQKDSDEEEEEAETHGERLARMAQLAAATAAATAAAAAAAAGEAAGGVLGARETLAGLSRRGVARRGERAARGGRGRGKQGRTLGGDTPNDRDVLCLTMRCVRWWLCRAVFSGGREWRWRQEEGSSSQEGRACACTGRLRL